jgi:6-pyruvoyltetrahydropterin/6-carboxytetrahydropterin synthase
MHITKDFTFDAAHQLHGLPDDHKCRRLHGHTYRVRLYVEGPLDKVGMIADYDEIAKAWAPIADHLDHRYLNDIAGLDKPTTENLARWIHARLRETRLNVRDADGSDTAPGRPHMGFSAFARVTLVRVYESSTTYCEVP